MSSGQLMAGVGQCRRIGEWDHHANNRYPGYRGYRHYGYYNDGYYNNGYRPGWDGGPVGWALGTAAGVTGAVTGLAVGSPYYYGGYGYGPNYQGYYGENY